MIIPALWLFAFTTCQSNKDTKDSMNEEKAAKVIKTTHAKSWEVNDFFSLNKTVPLSDSVLIHSINKLIFYKNKILILDKPSKSIIRFSETGDFEMIIQKEGKGPGEYLHIDDFLVESGTNDLLILGNSVGEKILRFDWEGNFKEHYPLPFSASGFELLENGYLFFCGNKLNKNALNGDKSFFNILFCDKNFNIVHKQLPIPFFWDGLRYIFQDNSVFCKYGEDVYCQMSLPNNTTIYKLQNSAITPHYYFDFGKDLKSILTSYNAAGDIRNKVLEEEFPCMLNSYFENDQIVHFVVMQGKGVHQVIYKKSEEKVYSRYIKFEDLSNHFFPIEYHGNGEFMVHVLTPFLIPEGKLEFELPRQLIEQVKPNSNPVLLFFDIN